VSAYNEKTGKGLLRHIYVRTNCEGAALVCLIVNGKKLSCEDALVQRIRTACEDTVGVVLNVNTKDTNVILGDKYRTLWGEDTLLDTLCGLTYRLSIPAFYQVNRPQAQRLYARAVELAQLTGRETVLDLYCGAGTITLVMAQKAKRAIGAEIVPEAIENAKENAKRNGVDNVEFFCGDAGDIAAKLAKENLRPDVVVVDPPRKGLSEDVVAAIGKMSPERVVYVSCVCATLARDVKRFGAIGYDLKTATAVDMFPRTCHIETAALLEKVR
ncbi:MAG: 23S rRNA (uracil(1939)-C(5))-methyltransferase RlmD, partial [Oscillospiraceae bacterium]|nr:23S rRNA (uracil(1939)-C(5))-methyltransferase RlmD [Oscillospiraceae bacterium]